MRDVLSGWNEIAQYIGKSVSAAQRYERTLHLPVRRRGRGPKPPVYALKSDLDVWLRDATGKFGAGDEHGQRPGLSRIHDQVLQAEVIGRVHTLTDLSLYRRNYHMGFNLKPSGRGVRISVDIDFELLNASDENQPFIQEITVDDPDHGHVQEMAVFKNRAAIYILKEPAVSGRASGYSIYRGKKLTVEPESAGVLYRCQASWVINRPAEDMWYNHMILPTLGATIDTNAPPEFEITRPFSTPQLLLKGEHLDIAWHPRK